MSEAEQTRELEVQAKTWPAVAAGLEVRSQVELEAAAQVLQDVKALRAEIESVFGPIVADALRAHRTALAQRARVEEPLKVAKEIIDAKIAAFHREEQRRAREERERIEREAREERELVAKWEREQREKLEAEARESRQAAEAARGDASSPEAESEARAALDRASRLESEAAAAQEREVEAAQAPLPALPKIEAPKAAGVAMREIWKFEVTDLRALAQAVLAGTVPIEAIDANLAVIGAFVRSSKGRVNWPGVRVYSETSVATR